MAEFQVNLPLANFNSGLFSAALSLESDLRSEGSFLQKWLVVEPITNEAVLTVINQGMTIRLSVPGIFPLVVCER